MIFHMSKEDKPKEMREASLKDEAESKAKAADALANQYFNNASVAESLQLISLLQLVKNQVISQSKREVDSMSPEQVEELLKTAEGGAPAEGG
jgi:hypothetical protein